MPTYASQLHSTTLFTALKAQITTLATPLYGTHAADASRVYDVIPYIAPDMSTHSTSSNDSELNVANDCAAEQKRHPSYGVALILYTGPASSPFAAWEMISCVHAQPSLISAAEVLLEELRRAMGCVVYACVQTGEWSVRHDRIPDVAREQECDEIQEEESAIKWRNDENGAYQEGGANGDADESDANAPVRWNPTLDYIREEH